jgi:hypothetical protein
MRITTGIATIAIASSALMMTATAYATQVIPKSVEFTNDKIEQGGSTPSLHRDCHNHKSPRI